MVTCSNHRCKDFNSQETEERGDILLLWSLSCDELFDQLSKGIFMGLLVGFSRFLKY